MSYYNCEKCGVQVSISRLEQPRDFRNRCADCSVIIASGEYEKNIKGGITLFATIGENLGHRVMSESLFRFYREQNPDETVYILSPAQTLNFSENYKEHSGFKKLFWADVSNIVNMPKDKRAIHYYFAREVAKIAELGYFPEWRDKEKFKASVGDPFYVLHLRNVHGNPEKNVTEKEAAAIFETLKGKTVFIVGNDMPFYQLELQHNFNNLRGKISLSNLAWLCGHKNCIATIGKDSGPMHLAAASGGRVVSYGYYSPHWIPKTKKIKAFIKINDEFDKFIEYLNNEL